jgi:hypothetical protein
MIEITLHGGNPAINIKCYKGFFDAELSPDMDPDFNDKWVQDNMTEEAQSFWWNQTAEWEVEHLIDEGKRIFDDIDYSPEIFQSGRSGGWLEVRGLPDPEDWDKDLIDAWIEFERLCTLIVEDFPRTLLETVYANVWEHRNAERDKIEAIWNELNNYLSRFMSINSDFARPSVSLKRECPLLVAKIEGKD